MIDVAASKGGRNFWNFERKSAEQLFIGLLRWAILRLLAISFLRAIRPVSVGTPRGCLTPLRIVRRPRYDNHT